MTGKDLGYYRIAGGFRYGRTLAQIVSLYPYVYNWQNNEKRATLKSRRCRVLARGALNSALVEFENGQREIISRNAIRKAAA